MLKRLCLAFAGLFSLVTAAMASGTIPYSLSQQLDQLGKPLSGGRLYLIQAGTTATPQNCYQDSGLTIAWPNPITLDSAGRIGQLFCADGTIKVRLTDKNGVTQVVADNIQVVGASSGGGGGGTVDPTTIIATGDVKYRYGTGVLSGFVRANGRTIGSATSGATERANADTQALFEYLWGADPNLAVSTGRGVSANADWTANKTLALPDGRGRVLAGLDDMGNSPAGRLTASYFGVNCGTGGTVLGAACGNESTTLALAQLPTGITSSGTLSVNLNNIVTANSQASVTSYGGGPNVLTAWPNGAVITINGSASASGNVTSNNTSGSAHRTVQPTMLITTYLKL